MYVYIVVHTSCYMFFSFSCSSLLVLSLHSSLSSVTNKGTHKDIYILIADWAMKWLRMKYRESQRYFFGKRGLPWHITYAIRAK